MEMSVIFRCNCNSNRVVPISVIVVAALATKRPFDGTKGRVGNTESANLYCVSEMYLFKFSSVIKRDLIKGRW